MSLIDHDVKEKIDEGTYLKMCDIMKNIHDTNCSKSICKIHFSVPYIRNYYNSITNANTREHNGIYISLVYSFTFMEVAWFIELMNALTHSNFSTIDEINSYILENGYIQYVQKADFHNLTNGLTADTARFGLLTEKHIREIYNNMNIIIPLSTSSIQPQLPVKAFDVRIEKVEKY